ncbi:MAG: FAD-dependent oxidoreductase [Clostridia bacterium]|nr:FAD-dependent oxidoreductase [Clostridia bacterium]
MYNIANGSVQYDVIVCGCGSAGFCAAIAAARNGAKTAVIEKYTTPGGILTVLGNNSIDQFNNPFREEKKMVIAGIGWEYVRNLYRDGFARIPDMNAEYRDHAQYGVKVNPVAAAKVMDDMLCDAGVDLYYGQPVVSAETDGRTLRSVLISTKDGLKSLTASVFIDCTGDGDLAHYAGAEVYSGDGNGTFQPGTLRFYPAVSAEPSDRILNYGDNRNHVKMNSTDSDAITRAEIASRQMLYRDMLNGRQIMGSAPAVAPREGRRIKGISEMTAEDYLSGKQYEDSVCYTFWFIDVHRDNEPAEIRYIRHSDTPSIRLSAMIAEEFDNLLMAGRCISTDRKTNSAIRVKASCMAMGEAIGTAAAIAVQQNIRTADISAAELKSRLTAQGAIVPGISDGKDFAEISD